jgi:hypothetical protein
MKARLQANDSVAMRGIRSGEMIECAGADPTGADTQYANAARRRLEHSGCRRLGHRAEPAGACTAVADSA